MKRSRPSRPLQAFGSFAAAVALAFAASVMLLDPVEVVRAADALPHMTQTLDQWWLAGFQP